MTLLAMFVAGWLARSAFVSVGIGNERRSDVSTALVVVAFAAALWLGLTGGLK